MHQLLFPPPYLLYIVHSRHMMIELLPSSSGGMRGRGVLPTSHADADSSSISSSGRSEGLRSGGIGNSGRSPMVLSGSGTRLPMLLSRQEEGLACGEGGIYLKGCVLYDWATSSGMLDAGTHVLVSEPSPRS